MIQATFALLLAFAHAETETPLLPLTDEVARRIAKEEVHSKFHWNQEGGPVRIEVTEKDREKSERNYSAKNALEALTAIRKDFKPRVLKNGDTAIQVGFGELKVDGSRTIYDIREELEQQQNDVGEGCPSSFEGGYEPLSWVGPVLSYEESTVMVSACGRADWGHGYHAVHLPSGKPARLLDYVEEKSLVAALKKDSYIRDQFHICRENIHTFCCSMKEDCDGYYKNSVNALEKTRRFKDFVSMKFGDHQCHLFGYDDEVELTDFAILKYDSKKERVAVRLAVSSSMPGGMSELGLWVKPKPEFRAALEKVKQKDHGFFMETFR